MTEDQIRDVIATWRARAEFNRRIARNFVGDEVDQCADDLERLLAERPPPKEAPKLCQRCGKTELKCSCPSWWTAKQEAQTVLCETCGHAHHFEADEAGFDSAEAIPWGKCKTCDCQEPSYTTKPLGSPTP